MNMQTSAVRPWDEESEASDVTTASSRANYSKKPLKKPLLGGYDSPPPLWSLDAKPVENKYPHAAIILVVLVTGIIIGAALTYLLIPSMMANQTVGTNQFHPEPYQLAPVPTDVPAAYYAAAPFNNDNLIPNLRTIAAAAKKPQTFDACKFIVQSTDDVWNKRVNVNEAIEKYFHEDYVDAGSWGNRLVGKKALKNAVWSEMRAFPDIQIHITDCLCLGNDVDGYKCAMPDVLMGTNTGPSGYGPPTGNRAKWTGLVQSMIRKNPETGQWQYYAEWGVHDEWALIQQLGLDFSRVPHPNMNSEPLHDGKALVAFTGKHFDMDEYDVIRQRLHDAEKLPVGQ